MQYWSFFKEMMLSILQFTLLGNSLQDYFVTLVLLTMGIGSVALLSHFVFQKLIKRLPTTAKAFAHPLESNFISVMYLVMTYFVLQSLTLKPSFDRVIEIIAVIFIGFYIASSVILILEKAIQTYLYINNIGPARKTNIQGIARMIKFALWLLVAFVLFDNLGINITPILAGLGIGGAAVALAAQTILKDLFSYFAIYFDKPFLIGDFITVDNLLGTVEYIGIKTTRLRSLDGEELILSNSDLTSSRIRNYKRMYQRRVSFKFKVAYNTDAEKLQAIPQQIKQIISQIKNTTFDRAHFASYDDYGLLFEVVYFVLSSDYNQYMDIQQTINLAIKTELTKNGVQFAVIPLIRQ